MINKWFSALGLCTMGIAILLSCNGSGSANGDLFSKKDTAGLNKLKMTATNAVFSDTPVTSSFDDPAALAKNKYNQFDTVLMHDLCNKYWKFDGGIDGGKSITELDMPGFWLQFNTDGKYEKGSYDKITSKGSFTVDNQGHIEMIPAKESEKKSEWQSKLNAEMLILVGTTKYADNAIQMRLSKTDVKPVKAKK